MFNFATPLAFLLPLPWAVIDPLVIALPVSLVVMVALQKHCGNGQAPEAAVPAG